MIGLLFNKSTYKIGFVGAGNALNALFGLIFLKFVTDNLTVSEFGRYGILTSLLIFGSKLCDFGSNSIFVVKSITKDDHEIEKFYGSKIFLFAFALVITLPILYFLKIADASLIGMFVLGLIFYAFNVLLAGIFQSTEKYIGVVGVNTIPAILKLIIVFVFPYISLSYGLKLDLHLAFYIFCATMLFTILFGIFLPKRFTKSKVSFENLKGEFKNIFPAGVSMSVAASWPTISTSVVKFSRGLSDVGVFYLAEKIANVFSIISLSIFTVLLPVNAKAKKHLSKKDITQSLFLGVLVMVAGVIFILLSGIFIRRFFNQEYLGSILILDILVFSSVLNAISGFMENHFYIEGKEKLLMKISILKLMIFLLFVLVLMPSLGLKGLAYSHLISSTTALIVSLTFIFKIKNSNE